MNTVIIYHHGCPDGVAGLWALTQLISMKDETNRIYKGMFESVIPVEEVKNKHVIFVDFSYKLPDMLTLLPHAKSILVLDHHKSAEALIGLTQNPKFRMILDMTRSGAQIAFDYVSYQLQDGFIKRPWFIDVIADRDLWKWQIPDSKELTLAMHKLGCYENLDTFKQILNKPREYFLDIGTILMKAELELIKRHCKSALLCHCCSVKSLTKTWTVMLTDAPHYLVSDVANTLLEEHKNIDFVASYRYHLPRDEWWISLRAHKTSNIDLSEVAKHFTSGGGHAKAAGIALYGCKDEQLKNVFVPISKAEQDIIRKGPNATNDEPTQFK